MIAHPDHSVNAIILLASASPRRRELLALFGIPMGVRAAHGIDETPQPGEAPGALVRRLSRAKARDVMTEGIHCCREDDDLAKAVHHMETLKVRRLPVINKSKRMVGMISLGDISQFAPSDLMSGYVKSVAAHH